MLLLAALPLKIAFDTVSGTMNNAARPSSFVPMSVPRSSSNVYTVQPQKQSLPGNAAHPSMSFVKAENPNIYLGSESIFITCPSCFKLITTKVIYEKGENPPKGAWLMCCSNTLKDALHYCPSCNAFLGKFVP